MQNETINNIIEEVLQKMTVSYDRIEIVSNDINTSYVIHTEHAGILIGNRGENLDALAYVVRKLVQARLSEEMQHNFTLDVNNYQQRKLDDFKKEVLMAADRVRSFGEAIELSPMNAYERMIVHSTFAEDSDVATESRGEGKERHIVLVPKRSVKIEKTAD
jgi:spoIIIJ-associated protein